VHALAAAVAKLATVRDASAEDVALNVGRMGGGTSVNSIPQDAWLELDLRAESAPALERLEREARAAFTAAVRPPLRLDVSLMGDRPGGLTPADDPLVRAACAATAQLGGNPELVASSTDANVAMALGVPAIALGAGGEAGGMHTLEEWYDNERGAAGLQRLALVLLLADRLLGPAQLDSGVITEAEGATRVAHHGVVADQ
jgi:acetylornithine deacetylase/succinyl-diaminopimelate desuccinylase-like protein